MSNWDNSGALPIMMLVHHRHTVTVKASLSRLGLEALRLVTGRSVVLPMLVHHRLTVIDLK
jgi:hypothetical protein